MMKYLNCGDMDMNEHLISVIIPTYNNEIEYFGKAIGSMINQTYRNIEIIIIDSSNNDSIKNYVDKLNDDRIRYVYMEKCGIAMALNYGLELSNGEYIARMDADDISMPERLEKQYCFLQDNKDVGVLGTSYDVIDENGVVREHRNVPVTMDEIKLALIFENSMCHPSVMFRKNCLAGIWKYENVVAEDYDLWTRMISSVKFANMDETLFLYRKYNDNTSVINASKSCESAEKSAQRYIEGLLEIKGSYTSGDFIRNYHLDYRKEQIIYRGTEFIEKQCGLMREIFDNNRKKKCFNEEDLLFIVNKRLKMLLNIYGINDGQIDLLKLNVDDLVNQLTNIVSFLKKISIEKHTFVIYGLGEQGKRIIKKYENLLRQDKTKWILCGLIDRNETEIYVDGIKYTSIDINHVREIAADYVIIASLKYYDEIRCELLKKGMDEKAVLNDACLYYMN